jgi:thioesterase domain-containing protein
MSVEAAARAYLRDIRTVAPRGPYRLLGHSFGGWIAFELARLLEQAGDPVDPVVLVDCEAPALVRPSSRIGTLTLFIELLEMDRGYRLPLTPDELTQRGDAEQLERVLRCLTTAGVLPPRTPLRDLQALLRVFGTHLNTGYQPTSSYAGRVLLINAGTSKTPSSLRKAATPTRDRVDTWRIHAPRIEAQVLHNSNHMNILKPPHVDRLAAAVRQVWAFRASTKPIHLHAEVK